MKYGQVWLVGAGPGDAGLLTLKGLDVINKADVVVYDKLVGHGVMSLIPKTCELIYVGKSSGNHLVPQEEINQIILDNALKGKNVVRLKGGDPFLFGRGAEEIELLYENNVEFEVVPGITSAISAPAYGGIPITHRDFASSVHIITGHFRDNSNSEIDFKSLVKVKGTLVFLMGISSLNIISSGLINGGMNEDMPCAIIQSGTTSKQRKVVSTIKNIEADARKKNIKSPGVIVVGEVCTLSEKFSWYENLSLHGMKILVTRPSELSSRLSSKLYNKGAEVVNMPSISTHKLNNKDFSSIIDKASSYEWIVFTSPTGARIFFEKLIEESIDIRKLSGIKFAAVGNATAKVIKDMGIIVEFVPSRFDGQTLGRELKVDGKVLIIRGTRRSEDITIEFSRRGIVYRDIPVYETNFESSDINYLDFDYITFTSGSTVEGFVLSTKARDYSMVNAICIGEQTESIAKKYNMNTYTAAEATLDSMVKVLEEINEVRNNGFNS